MKGRAFEEEKITRSGEREKASLENVPSFTVSQAEEVLGDLASVFFLSSSDAPPKATGANEKMAEAAAVPGIEARFRTFVEQIPAVIFMASLESGMSEVYVSPQIEAMLGFTQTEWLNDPVRWYWQIHPEDRDRWSTEAAGLLLTGKSLRSVYRVLARDGCTVWFRCEVMMVRSDDGRPWFIHGVAFDITDLKETEQALKKAHDELEERVEQRTAELMRANRELQSEIAERKRIEKERIQLLIREQEARKEAEAANRTKDEFLATVSHELRTPLSAILGWARVLRTSKLDEATIARAMESVERNAKAQVQLIEDLLDVSRIISGKLRLDVRPIELASVIEAAIDSVRHAADAKGIRLAIVLDPRASPVSGDAGRLQQVVWNLLSNAIKFTPKGGRVQVRLERINSHVEIIVSDTGEGISPEFMPRVFDRFLQADGSITRTHGGLGLGLAIVRHLVELHGGTVWADSGGEGCGATFTVQLPLIGVRAVELSPTSERVHPTAEEDVPLSNAPTLDGLRALVVDDETDLLEMLATVLAQSGAEVKTAKSSAEAFETLQEWKPDVLVSDIGMPGEDGYTLIRKVRALKTEEGQVLAVALTAHARTEDRIRALSSGFQIHMSKPVEPAELVVVIASLTRRKNIRTRG